MSANQQREATGDTARPAVRIRRGGRPETPMRVYIWSRPTPPGEEARGDGSTSASAPIVIELAVWLRLFMIAACSLVAVPLAGLIGFRQGFAEIVGIPDLQREPGASFSDGVRLILAAPLRIFDAGLNDTVPLMLAMLLVISGSGALALAIIGGRRSAESAVGASESSLRQVTAALGLVVCSIISIVQISWVIARSSDVLGRFMPWTAGEFAPWQAAVRVTAGVDLIALTAAITWLLVAVRLRSMLWLRSLTLVLAASAVAALFAAGSMTNSIASQIDQQRSLFINGDGSGIATPDLILGHTSTHLAVVNDQGELRLISPNMTIAVVGRKSIAEFVGEAGEAGSPRH